MSKSAWSCGNVAAAELVTIELIAWCPAALGGSQFLAREVLPREGDALKKDEPE
jgi:hypothetical protein